jgi:hypothetical protein
MVPPAAVHGVAPAADADEAEARLYQAMYVCTMHTAGLLHAIAAVLAAEQDGTCTLAQVAGAVRVRALAAAPYAAAADRWRYDTMAELCQRLT